MNSDDKFEYTYSAPTENERREILDIKKQYEPTEKVDGDFERLRKLDDKVKRLPAVISICIGVIGTLVMGLGMAMVLEWAMMIWGVIVGVAGLALAAAAYPIHGAMLKRNKKKYSGEILRLSEKLLKNNAEEKSNM